MMNIAHELLNFRIENRLFNFCVGESVGVHPIVAPLDFNYLETNRQTMRDRNEQMARCNVL